MDKKIIIKNLSNCPSLIPLVSKWMWQEWSKQYGRSLKEIIYRTEHCLTKKCPQTLVALRNNQPVGVVSLWNADYPYRQDLSPWLSTLFVVKKYRGLGIGQLLQLALLKDAKKSGFKKIYLMTELENYYEKTGWKFQETGPYTGGKTIRLYQYKLK